MLSAEWAEVTEDTLELRTKPKAARRPRLEEKPGGRRPDWLALGSRDLEAAACGWAAAVAVGAGAKTSSGREHKLMMNAWIILLKH